MQKEEQLIASMEAQLFGRTFKNLPITSRINRLESKLLGANQTGSTEERLERLTRLSGSKELPTGSFYARNPNIQSMQLGGFNSDFENYSTPSSSSPSNFLQVIDSLLQQLLNGYMDKKFYNNNGTRYYPYNNYGHPYYPRQNYYTNGGYAAGVKILND